MTKKIRNQRNYTRNQKLRGCNHCPAQYHLTRDHVVPRSFRFLKRRIFGDYCKINQQILCQPCNLKKGNTIYWLDILKRPKLVAEILRRMWCIVLNTNFNKKPQLKQTNKDIFVGVRRNGYPDVSRSNLKKERVMVNKLIADEILAHLKGK